MCDSTIVNVTVSPAWAVVLSTVLSILSFGSITVTGGAFAAGSSVWSVHVSLAELVSVWFEILLDTFSTTVSYRSVKPCSCRSGFVL